MSSRSFGTGPLAKCRCCPAGPTGNQTGNGSANRQERRWGRGTSNRLSASVRSFENPAGGPMPVGALTPAGQVGGRGVHRERHAVLREADGSRRRCPRWEAGSGGPNWRLYGLGRVAPAERAEATSTGNRRSTIKERHSGSSTRRLKPASPSIRHISRLIPRRQL